MKVVSRRRFLRLGLAAGMAAGSWHMLPGRLAAREPIQRPGQPKFKFSLAAYGFRSLLTGKRPEWTLEDFIRYCAQLQLEGTELTSYYFPKQVTPEYLNRLKFLSFTLGLDISGTAVGNDFCYPPGPQRQRQIQMVKTWIDHAAAMGAPVIRIFSGRPRNGQSVQEAHRLAVQAMEECCQYAGEHGVFLALENHGGLTTKIDGLLALVRDVKSPWLGVNLDTGNLHGSPSVEEAYRDMARMAPYAVNVQVKVSLTYAGRKRVPGDFGRLARILRQAGYRGYIVLEYEERDDPRAACKKWMQQLREAFA